MRKQLLREVNPHQTRREKMKALGIVTASKAEEYTSNGELKTAYKAFLASEDPTFGATEISIAKDDYEVIKVGDTVEIPFAFSIQLGKPTVKNPEPKPRIWSRSVAPVVVVTAK
jgi:hypothetical protein